MTIRNEFRDYHDHTCRERTLPHPFSGSIRAANWRALSSERPAISLRYTAVSMALTQGTKAIKGSAPAKVVVRPASPVVAPEDFAQAFLIRAFEQKLLALFSAGKLFGTVHTCIGQEFTGIAVCRNLRDGDLIFTNHRGHGHFLARTGDVNGLMAEIMGRQTGVCGGRGGSQHICSQGVFSNGIQGGIVPVSAGLALAQKIANSGNIVVVFIGDGTLGEGVIYEAFNIASKWELPTAHHAGKQSLRSEHFAAANARRRHLPPWRGLWHSQPGRRYLEHRSPLRARGGSCRARAPRLKAVFPASGQLPPDGPLQGRRRPR